MVKVDPFSPLPGSDLYYSLLYGVTQAQRDKLAIINALKSELCTIPVSVSDLGVACAKLEWWRLEAERAAVGVPRHQLTQIYFEKYGAESQINEALHSLIQGLSEEIDGHNIVNREQQLNWFDSTFGPLYKLQRAVLQHNDNVKVENHRDLGRWIEVGYSLLNLKPLAAHGLRRLPSESLRAAGCSWEDVSTGNGRVKLGKLIASECNLAINGISNIVNDTPTKVRRTQQPLLTLATIVKYTLIELKKDGDRVWRQRVELTPFLKLWLAWRIRYSRR